MSETDHPTKEEVRQYIKRNAPVTRNDVIDHFGGFCEECGSEQEPASVVDEHRIDLLDESRITLDANWNYSPK